MTTAEQYPDFQSFELAPDGDGEYWLIGHGEYEDTSVLAGQYRRARLDYGSLEEMRERYPDVELSDVPPCPSCMLPRVPDTLQEGDY